VPFTPRRGCLPEKIFIEAQIHDIRLLRARERY